MDDLAHLLLILIVFWGHPDLGWALLFGLLPDLLSFGPIFVRRLVTGRFRRGPPVIRGRFERSWAWLYNPTHSLFVIAVAIGASWAAAGSLWLPLLAWPLHVLIDIPTHSRKFFPTPILWPFSRWTFDGWSWGTRRMIIIIYGALAVLAAVRVMIAVL